MNRLIAIPTGILMLALLAFTTSCSSMMMSKAEKTMALKEKTLALMDKAKEPYAQHQAAVKALVSEINHTKTRVKMAGEWVALSQTVDKFVRNWKEKSKLGTIFIASSKGNVARIFGEIASHKK